MAFFYISPCERFDRIRDLLFCKTAHLGDKAGYFMQVHIKSLGGVVIHHLAYPSMDGDQPNRPVM